MPGLTRPVFKPHCHVEVLDGEAVFLLSESGHTLLRGRLYALLAPLLDGRTADEADAGGSGPGEALEDSEVLDWLSTATLANQPYLAPDRDRPARRAADFPYAPSADLLEDVRRCQAIVEPQGLEMLVLDQTRPDIGLPVVKVVVPGLRHFWARFAPGRLYDVPARMGWLPEPLAEEALNPVPIFI